MKEALKRAFTSFPAAIATYVAIAGFIGLVIANWSDIVK